MQYKTFSVRGLALAIAALSSAGGAVQAQAALLEDAKGSLTARNFYMDRNYVGDTNIAERREWAQGFILRAHSGYTEGHVGFGVDAIAQLGIKLDSSASRAGTNLLPVGDDGTAPSHYAHLGVTAKAKVSQTELRAGTLMPFVPVLFSSPARLLMQTFRGGYLQSRDIDGLTLHAAYIDRTKLRQQSGFEHLSVAPINGRFRYAETNKLIFAGGDYQVTPALTVRYYHAHLDEIYKQDYLGATHQFDLGPGSLRTDFRYFISREEGAARAGEVDNNNIGIFLDYSLGHHRLGGGYMKLTGNTAMPYVNGTEPLVHTEGALSSEFLNPEERVWQARYDYDFAGLGIPGLKAMIRYIKGTNINLPNAGGTDLNESTRDTEVSYTVQSGTFKDVAFRLRHARYRNNFVANTSMRDGNETRINVDYTFRF